MMNKRGHEAICLLHIADSHAFLRGLIWADFGEFSSSSSTALFAAFKGTGSVAILSAEGALALGSAASKVKLFFVVMFEEVVLSAILDLRPIQSRIIFVVGLKNWPLVAGWSVEVDCAIKWTCSMPLASFSVMAQAVGRSYPIGSEAALWAIGGLISTNSSAVYTLTLLYLSTFCPW